MEWVFLVNCADEIEASLIMGVLKEDGIPTMEQYSGSGGYMKIISGMGKNVDILVPASHHARATEILASLQEETDPLEP